MNLIKVDTMEYPITLMEFKARVNVSFGAEINPCKYGYYFVAETPIPSCTEIQRIVERPPAEINGVWTQRWRIVDLTGDELAAVQQSIAERDAVKAYVDAFKTAITNNLPEWSTVSDAIDAIADIEAMKKFLKKLARIIYLREKRSVD